MKKKIISICAALSLAAIAIAGGTMAYFTDRDAETNTFTVGGVDIELKEQQKKADGTLEDFTQGKTLMPVVQGENNELKNTVDKIVSVENTGKSDAYVRVYFAVPKALDDAQALKFVKESAKWKWGETPLAGQIGDTEYNVYYADYEEALDAKNGNTIDVTENLISAVYLASKVDMTQAGVYTMDGEVIDANFKLGSEVDCPVYAVAAQAAGFDNATAAINAAFPGFNPFQVEELAK